jgi:hypothetical protein
MSYTDDDEKDLKAIAKGNFFNKDGGRDGAYERQFGKRKKADAAPAPAITRPMGGNNPANAEAIKAMKCGGSVKKYAKGGSVDGVASRGKTKGRFV